MPERKEPTKYEVFAEGTSLCTFTDRKQALDYARFVRGFLTDVRVVR
jgi:hypothetical protein